MDKIDFIATDGIKLDGFLYKSDRKTNKVILSIHGMSSNCLKHRDDVIAKYANENNVDYFCFNNRGSELVKYIRKNINGKIVKTLGGTTYEDVLEGYEDIVGAIIKLREIGYENIYLQGHSLGCTKIVYTYNELKDEEDDILSCIKGIILLSLVDIPMSLKVYLGENYETYIKLAEEKEVSGNVNEIMPKQAFIHPISVKSFLRYARDNSQIDFAGYGRDNKLEKLNNIEVPLFMRWGNDNEMIVQKAEELVVMIDNIIENSKKNIDYIDGADHSYKGKEEILAKQILEFIKNID
ncbi:MAG: DUF1749 domain-containing protein [Clostridia bacterium]|nr:DUF1749 domain-containing protein [Clostridia bacterium]